jgi:hypothetical protein
MPGVAEWVSEFAGTAFIMPVGWSAFTFAFAAQSPMTHGIPGPRGYRPRLDPTGSPSREPTGRSGVSHHDELQDGPPVAGRGG